LEAAAFLTRFADERHVCSLVRPGQRRASLAQHGGAGFPDARNQGAAGFPTLAIRGPRDFRRSQSGGRGISDARNRAAPRLALVDFWRGWPYPVAVAALFVVVMLRAGGTYAIGRAAQEGVRRSRLSRVMAKPRFARMQRAVARWGAPVVTVSFLTVGIQTLVNLAAGVMRMPLRRYIPALIVGSILWAFLYATVGFATFVGWRQVYELSPTAAIVILVVLLVGLAGYIVWQVRHRDDEDEREPASFGS
jgi:membrane protein DedA with SNARE-associated domain